MDVQTIDNEYEQLQDQAKQTVGKLKELASKLQTSAQSGNQDSRDWLLDLREIALAIQTEQNQVNSLLQALHAFVANQAHQQMATAPQAAPQTQPWGMPQPYPQPGYPPQQPYPQQGGGLLGGLLSSGFGRAIAMGAGFGIGDDIINSIF